MRYFGHVRRMNDRRYQKIALFGGAHGIRQRGKSKKTLGRQHKGRLWNLEFDNNVSI